MLNSSLFDEIKAPCNTIQLYSMTQVHRLLFDLNNSFIEKDVIEFIPSGMANSFERESDQMNKLAPEPKPETLSKLSLY